MFPSVVDLLATTQDELISIFQFEIDVIGNQIPNKYCGYYTRNRLKLGENTPGGSTINHQYHQAVFNRQLRIFV